MRHLTQAIFGALLMIGAAGIVSEAAYADGTHYDSVCNCRRPDSEYQTKRYERAPARVVNRTRYVDHTRVVRGNTRLIQENRLIVHVRPVINREVVVHRTNTVVKDLVLHRVNTTNQVREEVRNETINRYAGGATRHIVERREVRGVNCNCGYEGRSSYRGRGVVTEGDSGDSGETQEDDGGQVSYRD